MAATKLCLLAAFTLLLCSWRVSASTPSPSPSKSGGKEFFSWVGKVLPEFVLKMVSCLKKNEKELKDTLSSLFADAGKCFDDSKGSVMISVECLLTNSVSRILSTMGVGQKVAKCALKKAQDSRLCVSVISSPSERNEKTCPFAIGF